MFVSAILAAGGRGTRMGASVHKQLLMLGSRSILQRSFETIEAHDRIDEIVVVLPAGLAAAPPAFLRSGKKRVHIVDGGARRQDSVAKAFARVTDAANLVVIHDAVRPFATSRLFDQVIRAANEDGAAIAALRSSDTVKEGIASDGARILVARTMDRDSIYLAQTPQAFLREILAEAIELGRSSTEATDEASLAERAGHVVRLVDGESTNFKITTEEDLHVAEALVGIGDAGLGIRKSLTRIGTGYDLHRLEPGRPLIIGGVQIPHEMGLIGHSDADVLCHAITDAILGAAALGDIGSHFPDTDPEWKGASSIALLRLAATIVRDAGFAVSNVDAVVIAEAPRLFPHVDAMRQNLADAMEVDVSSVSVKGKTNEKVGELGRNEAIAVHAVAALSPRP